MGSKIIKAHIRTNPPDVQSLESHLLGTAAIAGKNAGKIGFAGWGELLGLLHDIAKASADFQNYISAADVSQQSEDEESCTNRQKRGKIDHSTAGAQYVWDFITVSRGAGAAIAAERVIAGEILALCIASHHGGFINMLEADGTDLFAKRMGKTREQTHFQEAIDFLQRNGEVTHQRTDAILADGEAYAKLRQMVEAWIASERERETNGCGERVQFKLGCLAKFLLSSLIDADRCDTADFCTEGAAEARQNACYTDWGTLAARLEAYLTSLKSTSSIAVARRQISDACLEKGRGAKGIYTLTVPTGGGKTLAALRFALAHAVKHHGTDSPVERIIYVIPYTSIIDQNAERVRQILETEADAGKIVLECHSNLSEERESWLGGLLSENWDAPIVFTTNVQFLETLFAGGTKAVRKLHNLANSVIIFDEIQALPIKTIHLFCGAVDFLVNTCNATAVLCTATQPALNGVSSQYGRLYYGAENEIIAGPEALYKRLQRVEFINQIKDGGFSTAELADFVLDKQAQYARVLVVVNTTVMAKKLFKELQSKTEIPKVHLSAQMCAAHRQIKLKEINHILDKREAPLICVSTQVVEAGVDLDFDCGVRSVAGLDSIIQAGGRINREGKAEKGVLFIVNPKDENLDKLESIRLGRDVTMRIISELVPNEQLSSLKSIAQYYYYYFYKCSEEMLYSVKSERSDTILNLLSSNKMSGASVRKMRQAFKTAGELFEVIDAPTKSVLVPYGEGKELITALCGGGSAKEVKELLRKAQRYSVNLYPHQINRLAEQNAIYPIASPGGVFELRALREEYYSDDLGVSMETAVKIKTEVV